MFACWYAGTFACWYVGISSCFPTAVGLAVRNNRHEYRRFLFSEESGAIVFVYKGKASTGLYVG